MFLICEPAAETVRLPERYDRLDQLQQIGLV